MATCQQHVSNTPATRQQRQTPKQRAKAAAADLLLDDGVCRRGGLEVAIVDGALHLVDLVLLRTSSPPTRGSSRLHRAPELPVLVGQAQNHRVLRPGSTHV